MRRFGVLIAILGGFALSFDIPALKLGDGETWSVIALRTSLTAAVGFLIWWAARASGRPEPLVDGRYGALVLALYSINALTFLLAIQYTSVANVVFILALNPMVTALFSWWLIGERPSVRTSVAIAATLVGAIVIVAGGFGSGNLFGDAMALATTILLALALTLTRKYDLRVGIASLIAPIVPGMIAWAMVAANGFSIGQPAWIVLDGVLIIPIAFFCLAVAPRYVAAPLVAMAFLLETCFAPIWMWLVFAETPTASAMVGGSIILVAVLGHSILQWTKPVRARAEAGP